MNFSDAEREALRQQTLRQAAHEWIACEDRLPEKDGRYFVWHKTSYGGQFANTARWAGGWNCFRSPNGEISRDAEWNDIIAWAEIVPYKESEDD